ncbi:MAG: hypothetical protein Q9195_009114 [Heterodermia aff. obscurata]
MHLNINSSAPASNSHHASLLSLPKELLISIFCHLPSLNEAFVLSSACQVLQGIWLNSVTTIYKHLARRSIPCERHARQLLALQGGPSSDSRITSAKEVSRMMKNRDVVERAIRTFKPQIDVIFSSRNPRAEVLSDLGPFQHPPYLTTTERSRFTRSYYQLWGLAKIEDPAELNTRFESMTVQHLLHLLGIASPRGLPRWEEWILDSQCENIDTNSHYPFEISASRRRLLEMSSAEILRRSPRDDNVDSPINGRLIGCFAFGEGYYDYLILCDQSQSVIKNAVCGKVAKKANFKKYTQCELWDDSSDEDV